MQAGEVIQDRYRLDRPLGRGGMAEVWRAQDERLNRPVAVKFLAPQFHDDPEFLVRFFSEAQAVAKLTHPNVVGVLDFGQHEERPYLVMEYVSGGALGDLTGEPMLPERAVEIIRDAAKGAGAAHAAGLVHRDVKPANILLCDNGMAKLADFGIASSKTSERLTATGQAIGSPHYISPEQATGRPVDARSDVYALGIVLYELLTGARPFDAENVTAIAIAQVEKAPVPPSEHVDDLDPALEGIVMRCLSKDPDERFADGNDLAATLLDPARTMAVATAAAGSLGPGGWEVVESRPWGQRIARSALVVGVSLALVAGGVWAAMREPGAERPLTRDLEVGTKGPDPADSPKPKRTDAEKTTLVSGSGQPAPSPSATPSPRPTREPPEDGPQTEPEPEPDPEPTTEPEPTPTSEPTPEPTPTGQPEEELSDADPGP